MIAIVPHNLRKESNIDNIDFSQLIWISERPNTDGTINDLGSDDHIILYPSSKIWFLNNTQLKCNVSLIIAEPPSVHKRYYTWLWLLRFKFHKIFVRYSHLAIKCDNVICFPIIGCWTQDVDIDNPIQKNQLISIIASNRNQLPGHKIRHQIIKQLSNIDCAIIGQGYQPFKEKKEGLLPYNFSIIIENSQETDYFTEKLVDCFVCMTTLIYNIGNYFNLIKNLQTVIEKLSEDLYFKMQPILINNRKLTLNYANTRPYLVNALLEETTK